MKTNIFKMVVTVMALLACAASEAAVGIANYEWLGMPMGAAQAGEMKRPLTVVLDAYSHAKAGNKDAFQALFDRVDHGGIQADVDSLFTCWREPSSVVYTIAAECQMTGGVSRHAFLITAKTMKAVDAPQVRWVSPFVLYAQDNGSGWMLTTADLEPSVTESLLGEVADYQTAMHPSEEEIKQRLIDADRRYIEMLEHQKVPRPQIIAAKEIQEQANRGEKVQTWEDWKMVYRAQMLTNLPAFSCLEPVAMDFSTPRNAWRSRLYAQATGQIQILLGHADSGARARMKNDPWYSPANEGKNRLTRGGLTWVVPLLMAEAEVGGEQYVLFWSRSQDPEKGREGVVSFCVMVLRKQGEQFILTDDMESSDFMRLHDFAGPDGRTKTILPFGLYPAWRENWAKSKFPAEFYTIGD